MRWIEIDDAIHTLRVVDPATRLTQLWDATWALGLLLRLLVQDVDVVVQSERGRVRLAHLFARRRGYLCLYDLPFPQVERMAAAGVGALRRTAARGKSEWNCAVTCLLMCGSPRRRGRAPHRKPSTPPQGPPQSDRRRCGGSPPPSAPVLPTYRASGGSRRRLRAAVAFAHPPRCSRC